MASDHYNPDAPPLLTLSDGRVVVIDAYATQRLLRCILGVSEVAL